MGKDKDRESNSPENPNPVKPQDADRTSSSTQQNPTPPVTSPSEQSEKPPEGQSNSGQNVRKGSKGKQNDNAGNIGNSTRDKPKGSGGSTEPNTPTQNGPVFFYDSGLGKTLLLIGAILSGILSIVILTMNIAGLKQIGGVKKDQQETREALLNKLGGSTDDNKTGLSKDEQNKLGQVVQKINENLEVVKNLGAETKNANENLKSFEKTMSAHLDKQIKELLKELAKLSTPVDPSSNKGVLDKITELQSKVDKLGQQIAKDLQNTGSGNSIEITNKIKEMDVNLKKLLPELAYLKKSLEGQPKGGKEFAGPKGDIAIMITNSEDFKLDSPILRSLLEIVEKQLSESGNQQRLGLYMATGNIVDIKFNLKTKSRGPNPEGVPGAAGRPTENLADAGKTLMDTAFDVNTKGPRRAVIIATWEALAPRFNQDGWDHVETVDAILLQTRQGSPFRDAANWLDFCQKKKGKLLFVQGNNNFTAGSDALNQLKKHLSGILNDQEEKP